MSVRTGQPLDGSYDFTLSFSAIGLLNARGGGPGGDASAGASVLVIDSIQDKPLD